MDSDDPKGRNFDLYKINIGSAAVERLTGTLIGL
jgi:hypothetical protein